ncbi:MULTISPECIES: CAP domain-containing protein [Nocardioides]|uniref:CAP domain-containing protein n=1 Tax=Nocardioides vastitatis TaxID=2568655 RepID=A0ABW0ZHE6_9ACTN|nr:CAP domain-containing protein [Nocardioides sp.]THJ06707.1 CAP domain-containing protein [Nocardioides sp.]
MQTISVKFLVLSMLVALGLTSLTSLASSGAGAAPAPSRAMQSRIVVNSNFETRVIALTNRRRVANGCAPLRFNRNLRTAARRHTFAMARSRILAHRLPGEPRLGRRLTLANYLNWREVAENIAVGFGTPRGVVRAWMRSPTHRRNILDCSLREVGIGVGILNRRVWWTQDFGRR